VMKMLVVLFWVVTPCGLVGGCHISERHTVSIFRALKCCYLRTSPHGIVTQETTMDISSSKLLHNVSPTPVSVHFKSLFSIINNPGN
jgi:hypothetical protein